jgi:hypothetical protein
MADSRRRLGEIPRPPAAKASIDRRNFASRSSLIDRIRGEFGEMPGISLTLEQASRLFGVPPEVGARILQRLVDERVLARSADGRYRRRFSVA